MCFSQTRFGDLEESLATERNSHCAQLEASQKEVKLLQERMAVLRKSFEDGLLTIRSAVDNEVAAFQKPQEVPQAAGEEEQGQLLPRNQSEEATNSRPQEKRNSKSRRHRRMTK